MSWPRTVRGARLGLTRSGRRCRETIPETARRLMRKTSTACWRRATDAIASTRSGRPSSKSSGGGHTARTRAAPSRSSRWSPRSPTCYAYDLRRRPGRVRRRRRSAAEAMDVSELCPRCRRAPRWRPSSRPARRRAPGPGATSASFTWPSMMSAEPIVFWPPGCRSPGRSPPSATNSALRGDDVGVRSRRRASSHASHLATSLVPRGRPGAGGARWSAKARAGLHRAPDLARTAGAGTSPRADPTPATARTRRPG